MHRRWRRAVSVLSSASLLLVGMGGLAPLVSAAPSTPPASWSPTHINRAPGGGTPPSRSIKQEQVGTVVGRTADSTITVGAGGNLVATIHPYRVNYRAASGQYAPISNTLVPAPAGSGAALQNKANSFVAGLPAKAAAGPVRFGFGTASIAFQLTGATGAGTTANNVNDVPGTVKGPTDTFTGVLPDVNLSYTAQNGGLKEDVVLTSPSAPDTFTYALQVSAGLTPRENAQGGVDFVNGSGQVAATMPAPFMYDASGKTISHQVTLTLGKSSGGGYTLTLAADPTWLSAPGRQYPVTIDPSIDQVITGDTQDCYIVSGANASTNYCGGNYLDIGYDGSSAYRTLVYYNLAGAVPAQSQVLNAQFILTQASETTTNPATIDLYQLTQSWTSGATWNTYDGTNAWSTAGGTIAATPAATASGVGGSIAALALWPSQLVQGWVSGTIPNDGMLLKQSAENVDNVLSYYSGAASTPTGDLPSLQVTYAPWDGIQRAQQTETFSLNKWADLYVNVANGNLGLKQKVLSIQGTGLPLDITQYYNNLGKDWTDFGYGWSMSPSGVDVSLQIFGNGDVAYTGPSGYTVPFTSQGNDTFTSPPGVDATLVEHPGTPTTSASYSLTFLATGVTYNFDANGYLVSEVDQNGNTISLTNGAGGYTTSVSDTQGRTTTYSYNSLGVISTITDPAGRTYQFGYNSNGQQMLTYTNPAGGQTTYAYDANLNLTQITDPLGHETKMTYDSSNRVTSVTFVTNNTTGVGYTWDFTYYPDAADAAGYTVVTDPNGHETTYYYDAQGQTTKVVDANGNSTTQSYTADSNVQQYTDQSSATTNYAFGNVTDLPSGAALSSFTLPTGAGGSFAYGDSTFPLYPTSYTDPQGNTLSCAYDAKGNLSSVTDGLSSNNQYSFTYNGNGTLASMTDAMGNVTSYGYDSSGNLTSVTPPSPLGQTTLTYDGLSRVTSVTNGNGQKTSYTYNKLDQITGISYADGTSVTYTYDADGNVTAMTDATGTTTYTYDALNRETGKTLPSGATFAYGYDGVGNMTSYADSGGTVSYTYSPVNTLSTLTDPGTNETTYAYNAEYQPTSIAYPNGATMTLTYTTAGQMASIVAKNSGGTELTGYTYSYVNPANGTATALRYSMTDASGATTAYSYDVLNRLTEAKTTSGGTVTADYQYAYDGNGNRTSQDANGNSTAYTYNAANELTAAGATTYSYDANGNETGNSSGLSLTYNAANMTSSITPPNASAIAMTYTGATQTQRVAAGSTGFQYGLVGLASQTGSGATTYYTRTPSGQLVSERTPGGTYYYLFDGLGSVVGLTDSTGNLVNTYQYDPYGNVTSQTGTVANPWLFASAYFDSATGLYKMGARYYDPTAGRWTQLDPKPGSGVSPNTLDGYAYVANDPIILVDLFGYSWSWYQFAKSTVSNGVGGAASGAVYGALGGTVTLPVIGTVAGAGAGALVGLVAGSAWGAAGYIATFWW